MDRMYLAKHRVRVYKTQEDRDQDFPFATMQAEQWPFAGFVNYKFQGEMYPGFEDSKSAEPADACIVLSLPFCPGNPKGARA